MNLIDRAILEWSYKTEKGYPDLNNENDLKVFESLFGFSLYESTLGPSDLAKPAGSGENRGKQRIDILIDKIKNNEPLQLAGTDQTFLVYDPDGSKVAELENWDKSKGRVVLTNREGNSITTSKLAKTSEFGGGKGSGGGSAQTDIQESSMCAVLALYYKLGKLEESDLTSENLKSVTGDIDTTSSIEAIVKFVTENRNWVPTFISTAHLLSQYLGKGYEFHRGSSFTDSLYGMWNKHKKDNGFSMKNDKWNPSDIWAVKPEAKNVTLNSNSLEEYNNQILDLYIKGSLRGISLKKLGKEATVKILNKERASEKEVLSNIISSPNSKDAYIETKSGASLQLRTTGGNSFQGELKGKTANQGKIGGGVIKTFLEKQGLGPIPSQRESAQLAEKADDKFLNELKELCSDYFTTEIEELRLKSHDWLNSKYQALKIAKVLKEGNSKKVSDALTDIVNYAGSQSSISSIHLKVS